MISYLEAFEKAYAYEVYKKEEIPENLNYGTHKRIGDVFLKMKPGHYISSSNRINKAIKDKAYRGEHGFSPLDTEDMGAIFYAQGPDFKRGETLPTFENVHVYPLIARILGIKELPPIDGRLRVLEPALRD